MTEHAANSTPQTVSSPSVETSSPISGAHIEVHEFTPQEIQNAISESIRVSLAAAASERTIHSGTIQLHMGQPQVIGGIPVHQGAQYHGIHPSMLPPMGINAPPHSAAHTYTPYQPFSSNTAQHTQLTAATNNFFNGPSVPGSPQTSTPASTPAPHAPAYTTPSAPGATTTAMPSQSLSAMQQPPASQSTAQQQASSMNTLTSPPHGGLSSGSLAAHIQNVLATVSASSPASPHNPLQGTIQSQVVPTGSHLIALSQQSPQSGSLNPSNHTANPANGPAHNRALDRAPNSAATSLLTPESATKSPPSPSQPPDKAPREKASVAPPELREVIAGISPSGPLQSQPILSAKPPSTSVAHHSPLSGQSSAPEARPDYSGGAKPPEQSTQQGMPTRDGFVITPTLQPHVALIIQPLPATSAQPPPLPSIQQENERLERRRDIQQISAAEREPIKPVGEGLSRGGASSGMVEHIAESRERATVAIERMRESLIDRLTTIQGRIETTAAERQRRDDLLGPIDLRIQGRNNLVRPDPIHHDAKPSLVTRFAERLQENQYPSRTARESLVGLSSTLTADRARIRHIDSTSPLSGTSVGPASQPLGRTRHDPDRFSNVIDLLKRFSQRSINFQLLNKMDTSLERACLTVVTGAALGFVGLEFLYRAMNVAVLHTLGLLRKQGSEERTTALDDEQTELEKALERDLEEFASTELSTVGEQGFVVDLAGVVVSKHTETPLANVEVSLAEFGTCTTDWEGRFLFPNIPLGTPYTVSISSTRHRLKPLVVTGVCGELEFLRIKVERL